MNLNPLGRLLSLTKPPAQLQETVKDALGNVSTLVYASNANRLSASVDALANRTSFTYNLAGEQTAIQDARGK